MDIQKIADKLDHFAYDCEYTVDCLYVSRNVLNKLVVAKHLTQNVAGGPYFYGAIRIEADKSVQDDKLVRAMIATGV